MTGIPHLQEAGHVFSTCGGDVEGQGQFCGIMTARSFSFFNLMPPRFNDCLLFHVFLLVFVPIVSRLHCESESFKMDLILDINSWIYPMDLGNLIGNDNLNNIKIKINFI